MFTCLIRSPTKLVRLFAPTVRRRSLVWERLVRIDNEKVAVSLPTRRVNSLLPVLRGQDDLKIA